jgi:formate hydrogenlyase subunit 6/NADH:ubiquinone oxidoreductase subunit I
MPDDYMGRFCIDPMRCIDCGFCVGMCPADAIVRLADGEQPSTSRSRSEELKAWMERRQAAAARGG